ncbi:MAG: GTPase HflX [Bacteroidales bacterium]|nr:GTPase HflX [Bacteroidales bacterium]
MGEKPVVKTPEKAVLIAVHFPGQFLREVEDYLDELAFLAETAGCIPVKRYIQKIEKINPRTFIGKGKLEEIKVYIAQEGVDLVIFDEELSPAQIRNLDNMLRCRILDRTDLILDIFARRAKTAQSRAQVELAQYQHLLPRLTGMWTHLERQRGGIGLRGPGEREIETDRRIVRERITRLKKELNRINQRMIIQRKNRGKLVRVALIGYTNVGKSTLMNVLSKSKVKEENKLFATLDTTVRQVVIQNLKFLLSDTVGFIRKLPHQLVESFKSTLDEVRESDLLLHIVDISHPAFEDQISVVNQTLDELGAATKPQILVFNKTDLYRHIPKEADDLTPLIKENLTLRDLETTWMAQAEVPVVFISAIKKWNLEKLRDLIYREATKIHRQRYPYDDFLY